MQIRGDPGAAVKTRPSLPPRVITAHPPERAPCLHHWETRRKGRPRAATAQRAEAPTHGRPARSEAGRASWPRCSSRPLFPSPLLTLRKRGVWGQGWRGGVQGQSTPPVRARLPPHPRGEWSRTGPFQARPRDRGTQEVALQPCWEGR